MWSIVQFTVIILIPQNINKSPIDFFFQLPPEKNDSKVYIIFDDMCFFLWMTVIQQRMYIAIFHIITINCVDLV